MSVTRDGLEFRVLDEGTMDTAVECSCPAAGWEEVLRYAGEFASEWRDESGALDLEAFVEDVVGEDAQWLFEEWLRENQWANENGYENGNGGG